MGRISKIILVVVVLIIGLAAIAINRRITQLRPTPTIVDSPTSIIGFNHIGLSVRNLDTMLAFYQKATSYELIQRVKHDPSTVADSLLGQKGISREAAILKGPNMLLELTEYDIPRDSIIQNMPTYGPGMTHTCYQSAETASGFDKFDKAGARTLTRGGQPVALGNYGVSYAYAYDPEGNMMELEQMSGLVIRLMIGKQWAESHPLWMTQVAILTPDIDRLTEFYQEILGIAPYRVGNYGDNPAMDAVVDLDSLSFRASWFMLDGRGKKLELMQYDHPIATPNTLEKRLPTDLGYTYSFEVQDIQKEYNRLKTAGIDFISAPQQVENYWLVYARDIDGNVFSLRQPTDNAYSVLNFY